MSGPEPDLQPGEALTVNVSVHVGDQIEGLEISDELVRKITDTHAAPHVAMAIRNSFLIQVFDAYMYANPEVPPNEAWEYVQRETQTSS